MDSSISVSRALLALLSVNHNVAGIGPGQRNSYASFLPTELYHNINFSSSSSSSSSLFPFLFSAKNRHDANKKQVSLRILFLFRFFRGGWGNGGGRNGALFFFFF